MLNGERPECLLTGNRRRSQSGGADAKKAGEVAGKAAPPEQVWGLGGASHMHPLLSFSGSQSSPLFLGTPDKICMTPSRRVVGIEEAPHSVPESSFLGTRVAPALWEGLLLPPQGVCFL